jgi:hypothetical protein
MVIGDLGRVFGELLHGRENVQVTLSAATFDDCGPV